MTVAVLLVGLAACGGGEGPSSTPAHITVTSSVLHEGQPIPVRYTCLGEGVSPPLQWSGVPKDAAGVSVIVDDPDAPGGTFVHWVVASLPPTQTSLPEGSPGFKPPCPPAGPPHHYRFTVSALRKSGPTDISAGAIASGTLTATFQR